MGWFNHQLVLQKPGSKTPETSAKHQAVDLQLETGPLAQYSRKDRLKRAVRDTQRVRFPLVRKLGGLMGCNVNNWGEVHHELVGGFKYFSCSPLPLFGEMIQFDDHIFQMGWFNHQLDKSIELHSLEVEIDMEVKSELKE